MTELPPLLRDQRTIDADHLTLLAVFHFLAAALALLGTLGLLAQQAMMRSFFDDPRIWQNQPVDRPPEQFFELFKWISLFVAAVLFASAVLNLLSGFFIRARKYRTFSFVVAACNCLHIPLGTILGVFTFIVLMRDSVRELYEGQNSGFDEPR
jgi:hypothetical protein